MNDDNPFPGTSPQDFWNAQAGKRREQGNGVTPETARFQAYTNIRDLNAIAACDLSSDAQSRLQVMLGDLDGATVNSRSAISAARSISANARPSWQTPAAAANVANQAITTNAASAAKLLAGQRDVAAAIVVDSYAGSAPGQPDSDTDAQVADRKSDLMAVLSSYSDRLTRLQYAITVVSDASKSDSADDALTLYVLLG